MPIPFRMSPTGIPLFQIPQDVPYREDALITFSNGAWSGTNIAGETVSDTRSFPFDTIGTVAIKVDNSAVTWPAVDFPNTKYGIRFGWNGDNYAWYRLSNKLTLSSNYYTTSNIIVFLINSYSNVKARVNNITLSLRAEQTLYPVTNNTLRSYGVIRCVGYGKVLDADKLDAVKEWLNKE